MNMKRFTVLLALSLALGCAQSPQSLTVTVSEKVINAGFIGNGAQWDPYDEALSWGSEISEADWAKLFARLDYMKPAYVRCAINSPFTYYDRGRYDKNRNIGNLKKLLGYCQENDIYVIFGEYNPPTWEMKDAQEWVDMSVDFLNHLVNELGFSCIKHFIIFNEPDGNWASTNGDYDLWLRMLRRFDAKMSEYEGLKDKVSFAGPDAVINYKNGKYDTAGWISQSAKDADDLIGVYDVHSYPGQAQVRDGSYAQTLRKLSSLVPQGKKIVLGEAGYKYQSDPRDAELWATYRKRVEGHPFTKGSDCNMLVYDYFYGLDMPLLAIEAMNAGFSGLAVWMLDDAMHSNGDSGKAEDVKIWGMWNILGAEVFHDPAQEEVRPWYYSWSMMCRYFPHGCNILQTSEPIDGVRYVAAEKDGKLSFAAVNVKPEDLRLVLHLPKELENAGLYLYSQAALGDAQAMCKPIEEAVSGAEISLKLPANSFLVISEIQ